MATALTSKRFRRVVATVTLSVLSACGVTNTSLSARTEEGPTAYVSVFAYPSEPGTSVARIDLATDTTERPLRTTVSEPAMVAPVPRSGDLVVVGTGDDQLVEIDAATGHIEHRVVVGLQPDAVAVTAGGGKALVTDSGSGQLSVVDLHTARVIRSLQVGSVPDAVAISANGTGVAVVADEEQDAVVLVPLGTLRPGPPIPVGSEPDAVAVTPAGTALVADLGSDTVTPVDIATGVPGPPVPVGVDPTALAISALPAPGTDRTEDPAGTAWVAGGGSLVPIDLSTMAVGTPIALKHPAEALALTAGGGQALVADQDARVSIVDLPSGHVVASPYVGGRPSAIVSTSG